MSDSSASSIISSYFTSTDSESTLLSGSINFTGLGSGTDFSEIVDQLVEIQSIHMYRLESWKETWEARISSMEYLQTYLDDIESTAAELDTMEEFLVRTGASSDTSVVTASATNEAKTGAYTIEVGSDIKHILRSVGVDSNTTDVVSGDGGELGFYIGSSYTTVGIGADYSLDDIADAINAKMGSTVASVESDDTTSNSYHLLFTSTSGGTEYCIDVVKNPTDLSFDEKDVVLDDDSSWGDASIELSGQFTGDKATTSVYEYVFTAHTSGTTITLGSEELTLTYDVFDRVTGTTISSGTTITVAADYDLGDSIEVENGFNLRLGEGDVLDGESFTVTGFANDIDDAELTSWSGSTITTSGNYLGSVNKTYSFAVVTAGTIDDAGSEDTVVLRWTDSTGNTGTVSIQESNTTYTVDNGVEISLAAGTLTGGDTFQVNVFATDQQQGQDKGLAQSTKVVHSGWADETTTAVTSVDSTFSYTYGGQTETVSIDADATLYDVMTAINNSSSNPGVTASIIDDGQGLPTSFKLVLTGDDTGAQYQITSVSHTFDTAFSTDGDVGGGFTRSQWATNSMVKVDGYPSGEDEWLQRDSNLVDEVITGVTLNLHDAGESVITISNDIEGIYAKIEDFINAVNIAQEYIREETKYDEDGEETGVMIGNYSYYILKSRIDSALNDTIAGLVDGEDAYTCLADIGIQTDPDADGSWVINTSATSDSGITIGTTLSAALAADPEAVAKLFINDEESGSEGVAYRMYNEMLDLTDSEEGTLSILISNYNEIVSNIDDKIEKEEDRIALYEERQLARFARLETTLSELNAEASAIESAIGSLPSTGSSSDD